MAKTTCAVLALSGLVAAANAKVYYEEKFDDSWADRWTKSTFKQDSGEAGDWVLTPGKFFGDAEINKGIKTTPDARFYAISSEMKETFDNKDKDLVLQFSAKHEQSLDCGGGYIKIIPSESADKMADFGGDTPYSIMFGPDMCGSSTKRVHVIFTYKGKNLLTKKDIPCMTDTLTHVYTLIVSPDNTYKVLIDGEEKAAGSLYEDWDFLAPKTIKDPEDKKPEDWDETPQIPDPEDKKPEGYDDIPAQIPDPDAEKPEDWDDEDDGEWEAPMIDNPDFEGEWEPKMIDNPAYKGIWEARDIPNPDFVDDPSIYHFPTSKFVGFELWQVKSGSIFDSILVTDDVEYAAKFRDETWGATKDAEKAAFDKEEEDRKAKEEEERAKAEEERKKLEEEEGEDEEEEEAAKDDGKDEL